MKCSSNQVAAVTSIVDYVGLRVPGEGSVPASRRPWHRLATVRRLQGISRRTMARRMNVDVAVVRRQETETSDLMLSTLCAWQKALEVPLAELLVDSEEAISQPLVQRAQLVRLMKTALSILELADNDVTRATAQSLVDQLLEVMPELQGISAWNSVGKRRGLDELGAAAMRTFSEDEFFNHLRR